MPPDSPEQPRRVAIEQLEALGLSSYAARTFVALSSLGEGTARNVSDISDVPRTRVYDAIDELQSHGLVDVQHSTPKQFWVASPETTSRHFEQEYTHRVSVLADALDALGTTARAEEQRGVWTVTGHETVATRVREFVDAATEEVVYMTVADLLTDDLVDSLRTAGERGVAIKLAGMSPETNDEIRTEIPGAETFETLWEWSDNPAGRLLMVDREKTLVSVLVSDGDDPSESRHETAIWGAGETNSLVVVLKAVFTWQLDAGAD